MPKPAAGEEPHDVPVQVRPAGGPGSTESPVFSRDGRRLYYVETRSPGGMDEDGDATLVERVLADGSERRRHFVGALQRLQSSADGVVYTWFRREGAVRRRGIYQLDELMAEPRLLIEGVALQCSLAADGRRAELRHRAAKVIHIVDARGESGEPIPVEGEFEWVIDFDCDAQHDRLVVQTNLGASNQLVLIDLETRAQKRVVEVDDGLSSPRFSTDGETLYYLVGDAGHQQLHALALPRDGRYVPPRRSLPGTVMEGPISVVGDRVAFALSEHDHELWRLGPGESSPGPGGRLLKLPVTRLPFAVSPAGDEIAYIESKDGLSRLLRMPAVGGESSELYRASWIGDVAWSPDGRSLAFSAPYRGPMRV
ncbi:MAG: PD40 domain-containing protein, partial [Myxococcales bacterium]|nr:PD40 domain-containing protein [Myxococcales bacterium]